MVTAAVSEGAKGKDMLLGDLARNPLVAVHLLGSETQHNALLEENAQLKAELDDAKRKARRDSEKVLHAPLAEIRCHPFIACMQAPVPASTWILPACVEEIRCRFSLQDCGCASCGDAGVVCGVTGPVVGGRCKLLTAGINC